MPKFRSALFFLFLLPCFTLFSDPLSNSQLTEVVSGNSFSGHSSDSNRVFTLYFAPNGTVYINKSGLNGYTQYGKWKVSGDLLVTPWPLRDQKTSSNQVFNFYTERDLTVYKLQFNPIQNNIYEPYRPKTCSCQIFTPGPFPQCTWIKGKAKL